jgi:hypothetical protein
VGSSVTDSVDPVYPATKTRENCLIFDNASPRQGSLAVEAFANLVTDKTLNSRIGVSHFSLLQKCVCKIVSLLGAEFRQQR